MGESVRQCPLVSIIIVCLDRVLRLAGAWSVKTTSHQQLSCGLADTL